MATKAADKFKCPTCGSGRTKPVSVAISAGTRRRKTVGFSRRSVWSSASTYKTDLVSSLPPRPSNSGAYLCIFLGSCGLLLALLVGVNGKGTEGAATVIGLVSFIVLLAGTFGRKPPAKLADSQASWDRRWMCARCGHQWQP